MNVSDIKSVACLGGGIIGSSWAIQFAMHGLDVAIRDINEEQLEKSRQQMEKSLGTLMAAGFLLLFSLAALPPSGGFLHSPHTSNL